MINEWGEITCNREEKTDNLVTWLFEGDSFIPAAKIKNGKTYSIVTDYLGTPQQMYDEEGHKIWEAVYDIYGKCVVLKGDKEDCPFRYQGQYEDVETGLYYNRFRYYSAEDGNYVSQDPIRILGGITLYSYVNNPTFKVDLFGLMPWEFMNGASADISNGSVTQTFHSSTLGHAEINGLNHFADNGLMGGNDITISNVMGNFNPNNTKPVGVCTNCRGNMFDILERGGATSVTMPITKGNKIRGLVTILSNKFGTVSDEINKIRSGSGTDRQKSDAAWGVLQKHSTCK